MGLLDRLRKITFARPKEDVPAPVQHIVLGDPEIWVTQLLDATGLMQDYEKFIARASSLSKDILAKSLALTDEKNLDKIPQRARTVNALHADQFAKQVRKLMAEVRFSDIFTFEHDQLAFHEALGSFKDRTSKSIAALQEYLGKQVKSVQHDIQTLEDEVIRFLQVIEEKNFSEIKAIKEAQDDLGKHAAKNNKHRELLTRLRTELAAMEQKRKSIEQKIRDHRALVRNQEALQALEKLSILEEELDTITGKYRNALGDAARYFKKYADTSPPDGTTKVITELPKDPTGFLSQHAEEASDALSLLWQHFDDEAHNTGNLVQRLRTLADSAIKDGRRIKEVLPEQKTLRQAIMRDIATLNIYDQQQFLLRAKREEAEISAKLSYVEEQLEGGERIKAERKMRDAVRKLGATFPDMKEEEPEDMSEELEHAADDLEHEEAELETKDHDTKPVPKVAAELDDLPENEEFARAEEETEKALAESAKVTNAEDLIRQVEAELEDEEKPPK